MSAATTAGARRRYSCQMTIFTAERNGRIVGSRSSTTLESISMRPSSKKRARIPSARARSGIASAIFDLCLASMFGVC
jgi:hypothetical protein